MTSRTYSKWHKCPRCNGRIVLQWAFNEDVAVHEAVCENAPGRCDYKRKVGFKVLEFE